MEVLGFREDIYRQLTTVDNKEGGGHIHILICFRQCLLLTDVRVCGRPHVVFSRLLCYFYIPY